MEIRRKSPFTGKEVVRDVPCTPEQYSAWQAGELIQDAMPDVPADDREFIISGITPEEWSSIFG